MLGLRYFACVRCATVYALPADEERCEQCGDARLEELPAEPAEASYFTSATKRSD